MNAEELYFRSYDFLSLWNDITGEKDKEDLILNYIRNVEETAPLTVNDFDSSLQWFNVANPLTLKALKGKVVVLDFFTYCCINCMHILPDLDELESRFTSTDGLVVVGVHSAKFDNEKDSANILSAIIRYDIKHPVVNDSDGIMWSELQVSCWPTLLILGPDTKPLVAFVGEGHRQILVQFVSVAMDYYKSQGKLTTEAIDLDLCRDHLPPSPLLFPGKLSMAPNGSLVAIADTGHHRLVIVDKTGVVQCHIGCGQAGFADGGFKQCSFRSPQGVCWSEDSDMLYVADTENHAVRQVNMKAKEVVTIAGTGKQGQDLEGGNVGEDQCISSPWDVVLGKSAGSSLKDVLYIAMAGSHQIWALILAEGGATLTGKTYPQYTCVRVAGSGKEENRNNSYPHKAGFAQPSGVCIGEVEGKEASVEEHLFVADSESSTIRSLSITQGQVKAVKALVGGARDPTDLFAYGDKDGESYDVKLQHPLGIATRTKNKSQLIVADSYNHKIKLIDVTSKRCETVYNGEGTLNEPGGICAHPTEDWVYIADTNNHSIKCLDLTTANITQFPIIENETDGVVSKAAISPPQSDNNNSKPQSRLTNKRAERRRQAPVSVTRDSSLHLTLTLTLGTGLHFTEGTTSATQILMPGGDIFPYLQKDCEAKQNISDDSLCPRFILTFPKTCDLGDSFELEVESIVYYCSDEGVCKMKATVFEIPVTMNSRNITTFQGEGQTLDGDKSEGHITNECEVVKEAGNTVEIGADTTDSNVSTQSVCLMLNIDL